MVKITFLFKKKKKSWTAYKNNFELEIAEISWKLC